MHYLSRPARYSRVCLGCVQKFSELCNLVNQELLTVKPGDVLVELVDDHDYEYRGARLEDD